MRGSVTRRGANSWRLKFDVGAGPDGKRVTKYCTVRGLRRDAEKRLAELLNAHHAGTYVDTTKITVAEFAEQWLTDSASRLAQRTLERYRQLLRCQIVPYLGGVRLQALRPIGVAHWHGVLLAKGGKGGKPLGARTVGHCHRLLHVVLERAVALELVARNAAGAVRLPTVQQEEIEILQEVDVGRVQAALAKAPAPLPTIVVLALGTGCRRGELLGLGWDHVDLDAGIIHIRRSLGQAQDGKTYLKAPKTAAGSRTIRLPARAVEALRAHYKAQLELRMKMGLGGRPDFVFADLDGNAMSPNGLSRAWGKFVRRHGLPRVSFHALRHTSVSMLINAGLDPVSISKRIGHSNPSITLRIYSHLFRPDDRAHHIIDAALGGM
jgi:integrase